MASVEGCVGTFNKSLGKLSKGELSTSYSGPEVVPTIEQFQPVQSGIFDMLFTIGAYHLGTTAIGAAVDAIDSDPVKRRQHGIFDYVDRHYNKLGVKVIAIIFKKRCQLAGLDEKQFGSRSLRSGFVTECINQGIGLHEIRKLTNHSSFKSLEDYAIGVSVTDSPAAKII